ncbi:HAD family hydrolase [Pseudonocardia nigra]|uniref:HAD family hydrolase n=1 Tax=Pseudonocardia nigra TaxID=1921578 RepID=UPI001C6025AD|nr:HAD family hydrolase [Pseudonocardia nigra]
MSSGDLATTLRAARAVLFDFDGPICSVFAGFPAPTVAYSLRTSLEERTGKRLALAPSQAEDPLEVLRLAPTLLGPDVAQVADDLLTTAETTAAGSASPTPGGDSSLRACAATGRRVAIVSNNSGAAVREYLGKHGLTHLVGDAVVGRAYGKPHLMKPDPSPIEAALRLLGVEPNAAVLVGDSVTDVEASRAAGVACIGYANKPGKRDVLAGADAVIEDMRLFAEYLARVPVVAPR